MTYDEWKPRYTRLTKAYSKPVSGEQCEAYFEALKSYPESVIEQALARVISEEKYWPVAATIREAASSVLAGVTYAPSGCGTCHGALWVPAADQQHFGRTYGNYAERCPSCYPRA